MRTLNLESVLIDYDPTDGQPVCARLPDDPVGRSSLDPDVETAILESDPILHRCRQDAEEPRELDFG